MHHHNPATLLPLPEDGKPHDCVKKAKITAKVRSDLQEMPLQKGKRYFRRLILKERWLWKNPNRLCSGDTNHQILVWATPIKLLSTSCRTHCPDRSVQTARNGRKRHDHANSQYTFSTVHVFAQQWHNHGMVTITGKTVTHACLLEKGCPAPTQSCHLQVRCSYWQPAMQTTDQMTIFQVIVSKFYPIAKGSVQPRGVGKKDPTCNVCEVRWVQTDQVAAGSSLCWWCTINKNVYRTIFINYNV